MATVVHEHTFIYTLVSYSIDNYTFLDVVTEWL